MIPIDNSISTNQSSSKRIDWLDLLKGFAILWIVWYHQPHPNIVDHYFHVPIFFFISGVLFKQKPPKQFFKGVLLKIIIPFLFFYLISYCFQIARFVFENSTINGFDWACFLDIFRIENNKEYLTINIPLWFLISLAVIQTLYYYIGRLPKPIILSICILIIFLKGPICSLRSPFMINQSIFWMTFFALGDIVGKWIVSLDKANQNWKLVITVFCVFVFGIISLLLPHIDNSFLYDTTYEISVFSFVILSVVVFSFLKGTCFLAKVLRFYGQNSLIVLGLHLLVSIIYGGILFKLFGITGNIYIGFANFILTVVTLYPIIIILNKFLPYCVGKSKKQ